MLEIKDNHEDDLAEYEPYALTVEVTLPLQVVKFNSCDTRHIITTGDRKTMFWGWEEGGLRGYIPRMSRQDFKKVRSPLMHQSVSSHEEPFALCIGWITCAV